MGWALEGKEKFARLMSREKGKTKQRARLLQSPREVTVHSLALCLLSQKCLSESPRIRTGYIICGAQCKTVGPVVHELLRISQGWPQSSKPKWVPLSLGPRAVAREASPAWIK